MKLQVKKGITSKLLNIFIQDSSVTTGAGLTGLVFNSAGLTAYYYREGAASAVAITLTTMVLGTWTTGGFIVIDGTNMPGCYQLSIPDLALATGANSVIVMLKGATNMAQLPLEIELVDNVEADTYAIVNHATYGNSALNTDIDAILDDTGTSGVVIPQAQADKVWLSATRTLTAFSTALALSVWDVLESAILTASSIGLKVKNNLDAAITSRLASGNVTVGGYAASQDPGTYVLVTPANKLATDASNRVTVGTNADKTGYALSAAGIQAIWDALTSALITVGSIGKLLVDNINATISSRLAASAYTAPDNTGIAAIKAKTDYLPSATAGAAGGVLIAGSNAATTFATLTVTGATTFTGNVAYQAGITITQSTLNGHGISVTGNGTGSGMYIAGGATGVGLSVLGGSTSGDGIKATVTSGVPIRGDITGNITGNLSGSVGSVTADVGITQAGADKVWNTATRTLTSFGTLVSDIWNNTTRTLTTFSTGLAVSVWDVLETAIATASSIGLKVKNNLDAAITSRLASASYTAPDNTGITAIKAKTDTILWTDIIDIKDSELAKWSINKTTNVLTIYKADGVTVLKQFNLTDNASVSERVPV